MPTPIAPDTFKKLLLMNSKWMPIIPVPDDAPPPNESHYKSGKPEMVFRYRDSNGKTLGYTYRLKSGKSGKVVIPLTYCHDQSINKKEWRWQSWDVLRPMFNIFGLYRSPKSVALVVEGEKCATVFGKALGVDGMKKLMPVSWVGGSNATNQINFFPLEDRRVILWPDADLQICKQTGNLFPLIQQPGIKAMISVASKIEETAKSVIIVFPDSYHDVYFDQHSEKFKFKDRMPNGWDVEEFVSMKCRRGDDVLTEAIKYVKKNSYSPAEFLKAVKNAEFRIPVSSMQRPNENPPEKLTRNELSVYSGRFTDMRNAEFFKSNFDGDIRYNHTSGKWLNWDGTRWETDDYCSVVQKAKVSARKIAELAATLPPDSSAFADTIKHALKSESRRGLTDMIELAKTIDGISKIHTDFDRDHMKYNVNNGTVDLKTGGFSEHGRGDNITKLARVNYSEKSKTVAWDAFLEQIFAGDADTIRFVQKAVGYTLTGLTDEQCVFFCYGCGANGKSVFFEALKLLFGDYYLKAPAEMIMARGNNSQSIPNDVARLPGARLVVCSELQENQRFNEALIKDLTGQDTVVARFLHKEFFEFTPTHKLWMYGNHKPNIRGTDKGIWRRIRLIPFMVTIPPEQRLPMAQIVEHFRGELSGILKWAIDGYNLYQTEGLESPQSIKDATDEYQQASDIIGSFIDEACLVTDSVSVSMKELYGVYKVWCDANNEYCVKKRKHTEAMRERGFINERSTGGLYHWRGIAVSEPYSMS